MQYFEDQYAITHRLLGSGQFGQVYLAHKPSGAQLACKIVDLRRCGEVIRDSSETLQDRVHRVREEKLRIFNELKILSELSHVSIEVCPCRVGTCSSLNLGGYYSWLKKPLNPLEIFPYYLGHSTNISQPHIIDLKKAFCSNKFVSVSYPSSN